MIIQWTILIIVALLWMACVPTTSAADHRCTRIKTTFETKSRMVIKKVTEKYWGQCRSQGLFWRKCLKTRLVDRPDMEDYTVEVEVPESVCCDGYEENYDKECVAQCPAGKCLHGWCAAPDQCECDDGYVLNRWDRCEPHCDNCQHGICSEPNNCICDEGYRMDQHDHDEGCQPVCDPECEHSTCVSPNQCDCNTGYGPTSTSNVCEPLCNDPECDDHGVCIAPNQCQCHDGYRLTENSSNVCEPVCTLSCLNGVCVAPDHCECNEGFRHLLPNIVRDLCIPICDPECGYNGRCTQPGHCECDEGYHLPAAGSGHDCQPLCDSGCENGLCVAPNRCACNVGFVAVLSDTHCKAVCDPPCNENGVCVEPGRCHCFEGYRMANDSRTDCRPVCEPACRNAACVAPNLCECHDAHEFELGSGHRCRPRCEPMCVHGECVAPDRCQCAVGYDRGKTEPVEPWRCVPQCGEAACRNGYCAAPGVCGCNAGFEAVPAIGGNVTECRPICNPNCGSGGACVAPNVCECLHGYSVQDQPNVCVATPTSTTTTMAPSSEHLQPDGRLDKRMPCIRACGDQMPTAEDDHDVCIKCDTPNLFVLTELESYCGFFSKYEYVKFAPDLTQRLIERTPEVCRDVCSSSAQSSGVTAKVNDGDGCKPMYGYYVNCTVVGCVSGKCDSESGMCTCDGKFEEKRMEDGCVQHVCVGNAAIESVTWTNVTQNQIILVCIIACVVVISLAAVYAVYSRKNDFYTREDHFVETSSI